MTMQKLKTKTQLLFIFLAGILQHNIHKSPVTYSNFFENHVVVGSLLNLELLLLLSIRSL